jgi:hypothetical protein
MQDTEKVTLAFGDIVEVTNGKESYFLYKINVQKGSKATYTISLRYSQIRKFHNYVCFVNYLRQVSDPSESNFRTIFD